MAGQNFTTKLKEDKPLALLVLLHRAVLLETSSELWWAKTAGKRLVEDEQWFWRGFSRDFAMALTVGQAEQRL